MCTSSSHSGPGLFLSECCGPAQHPGTSGLCPAWGTQLLLSLLQVQAVANLSTYTRGTRTHTKTGQGRKQSHRLPQLTAALYKGLMLNRHMYLRHLTLLQLELLQAHSTVQVHKYTHICRSSKYPILIPVAATESQVFLLLDLIPVAGTNFHSHTDTPFQ